MSTVCEHTMLLAIVYLIASFSFRFLNHQEHNIVCARIEEIVKFRCVYKRYTKIQINTTHLTFFDYELWSNSFGLLQFKNVIH